MLVYAPSKHNQHENIFDVTDSSSDMAIPGVRFLVARLALSRWWSCSMMRLSSRFLGNTTQATTSTSWCLWPTGGALSGQVNLNIPPLTSTQATVAASCGCLVGASIQPASLLLEHTGEWSIMTKVKETIPCLNLQMICLAYKHFFLDLVIFLLLLTVITT